MPGWDDLTQGERAAVVKLPCETIAANPFPLSPRLPPGMLTSGLVR